MADINDDDLSILTDEERAGLEEGDDADSGDEGGNDGDASDEDDDSTGDDDQGEGDDAGANGEPEGKEPAVAPASDAPADDDDDDDDSPVVPPATDRVNPADAQAKLDDITSQKTALAEKLDDGEITTKEYTEAVDKLNDERNTISNTLARQQEQDEAVTNAWYKDVDKFLDKNPDLKANQTRLQSFDVVVRRVTEDQANAGLSNRKQLEKARDIWREEMGIPSPSSAKPAPKAADVPAEKPKPKAKAKVELPPTLHNVPAADINDTDDGKYSYLDALLNAGKSIEYEDALAKLSNADQQEYLGRA
jgi:hypothetical protein